MLERLQLRWAVPFGRAKGIAKNTENHFGNTKDYGSCRLLSESVLVSDGIFGEPITYLDREIATLRVTVSRGREEFGSWVGETAWLGWLITGTLHRVSLLKAARFKHAEDSFDEPASRFRLST